MTHDEVIQHLQGGQVQISGQHVPLLGHGDAIESTNSNPLHVDEIWHHWWCHQCLHSPMTHHSLEASRRYLTFLFVVIWHYCNLTPLSLRAYFTSIQWQLVFWFQSARCLTPVLEQLGRSYSQIVLRILSYWFTLCFHQVSLLKHFNIKFLFNKFCLGKGQVLIIW